MGNSCRGSLRSKSFGIPDSTERSVSKRRNHNHAANGSSVHSNSSDRDQFPEAPPKPAPKPNHDSPRSVMRRGVDPGASSVLGHKTPNIRDIYTLGRKLGQGQFGTTYLCTENSTGIDYACKSISKRKLLSREDVEDVRREIQIMHHLAGHKNVVTIKGAYEDTLYVHIVMELCAGGELFDRIIQRGHYSERKAADITKIIVGVVEACHSLGVMHRDLKPENFLLVNKDDDLSLKAIDFGLSMFFKPGQIFADVVGSPYYVAPEVLCKHYGPEADVWTAGVILYILLSGVPPFWAVATALHVGDDDEPPPPPSHRSDGRPSPPPLASNSSRRRPTRSPLVSPHELAAVISHRDLPLHRRLLSPSSRDSDGDIDSAPPPRRPSPRHPLSPRRSSPTDWAPPSMYADSFEALWGPPFLLS